jgi:DNA polymerase II small subunit
MNIIEQLERGILTSPDSGDEVDLSIKEEARITVIENYEDVNVLKSIKDFVKTYNKRYSHLQNILKQRQELSSAISIKKIFSSNDRETVSFIGMILEIAKTKNDNLMITLEDPTGTVKGIITKNNKEIYSLACNLTPDEVIGASGMKSGDVVFINNLVFPDIPLTKELKKSLRGGRVVFISDVHLGSKMFLKEKFEKFISWVETSKIDYLFILGDLVEGIGIFPGQEKELEIIDIYEQYKTFEEILKRVKGIKIIICPGNHDSVRVSEPQPRIPKEFLPKLYENKDILFVSSPSVVKIGQDENFSGFDVLIYHGFSFPYYASNIESIRMNGGLEKTEEIMEYLLKRRHLAPTHGSTQYQVGYDTDPLVIRNIPDFFVTGHIHRCSVKNYRGVTMLNCSCWISQTDYQEKRGLVPEPGKAIHVDLKTRDVKVMEF